MVVVGGSVVVGVLVVVVVAVVVVVVVDVTAVVDVVVGAVVEVDVGEEVMGSTVVVVVVVGEVVGETEPEAVTSAGGPDLFVEMAAAVGVTELVEMSAPPESSAPGVVDRPFSPLAPARTAAIATAMA